MWNGAQDYARYEQCMECGVDLYHGYLCDRCKGIDPDGDNCHWLTCDAEAKYVTPSGQYCYTHTPANEWANRQEA